MSSASPAPRPLIEGTFLGGFECSSHQLQDGRRLDLTRSTRHAEFARLDYARLRALGIAACRDGVNWARCEPAAGRCDFASVGPLVHAARQEGIHVIWDLMHFGWPSHIDVFATGFARHFAQYARRFAEWLDSETDQLPILTPINEMSFLAWAGGDVACMNPFQLARGVELKAQLVRATIEAIEEIRAVLPRARFLQPEPVINIVPSPEHPKTWRRAECDQLLQYQAFDMLTGEVWPSLGGHPRYLDVIGINFYPDNQFMLDGTTIHRGDERYKPFSSMAVEVWKRYERPLLVSETGDEGSRRADWLAYMADECVRAMEQGCELHGITLYPIVNHPGWLDDRHCQNGLWDYADDSGHREIHAPLAEEVRRQSPRLDAARAAMLKRARAIGVHGPDSAPRSP